MFNKNPTIILNGVAELIKNILPVLVLLGLIHLTSEQVAGWIVLSSIAISFITTTILRTQVVPNDTANKQIQVAVNSPKGTEVAEVIAKTAELEKKESN